MGTRNLTMVVQGGKFKVAQYGQWDGYPGGQGATVLGFLKSCNRPKFEKALKRTKLATDKDLKKMQQDCDREGESWWKQHPEISRDTGAGILDMIAASNKPMLLKNSIGFAGDSLFCEYAYLIDLDKNRLEVYKGFNQSPLEDGQRFKDHGGLEKAEGYSPIRMVKSYSLKRLPSVAKMSKDIDPHEDE